MSSSNALLGAISSIRFRPDRKSFLAVMDTGHWVEGEITRDAEGRLSGVSDLTVTSMIDPNGRSEQVKGDMDSEGLALRDGEALASIEQMDLVEGLSRSRICAVASGCDAAHVHSAEIATQQSRA